MAAPLSHRVAERVPDAAGIYHACWSGEMDGENLTYAQAPHPEYRRYVRPQVIIVPAAQGQDGAQAATEREPDVPQKEREKSRFEQMRIAREDVAYVVSQRLLKKTPEQEGRIREQAAQEALRWIAGGVKSKQGTAVLDALALLDGDQLRPRQSRYAKHVLDLLSKKKGQVLGRSELLAPEDGVDYWTRFRLEPEFLAVVLAALVCKGHPGG